MAPETANSMTGDFETRISGQIPTCRRNTAATTVRGVTRWAMRRRIGALAKAAIA